MFQNKNKNKNKTKQKQKKNTYMNLLFVCISILDCSYLFLKIVCKKISSFLDLIYINAFTLKHTFMFCSPLFVFLKIFFVRFYNKQKRTSANYPAHRL